MPAWYLAPSLRAAFDEVNRLYPDRSKRSDGSIGDEAHRNRRSDHNPDPDTGVVRAIDITHDPDSGADCHRLAEIIRVRCASGAEDRVSYVIWNRRITSGTYAATRWEWRRYDGSNPHTQHMHISIEHTRAAENDRSLWWSELEEDMTPEQARQLSAVYQAVVQGSEESWARHAFDSLSHGMRPDRESRNGVGHDQLLAELRTLKAQNAVLVDLVRNGDEVSLDEFRAALRQELEDATVTVEVSVRDDTGGTS